LRQGVTFHDGSALTADDVIFNIKGWLDPSSWAASNGALEIDPERISKLDDRTVRFSLTEADSGFDRILAFPPFSIKSRNEKKGVGAHRHRPFPFVSFTPGIRFGIRSVREILA
jgi:peptide/nickel transport system substrate-binding protein